MATERSGNSAHLAQIDALVATGVQIEPLADDEVSRRKALGRLAAYAAPAMLAMLTSAQAVTVSTCGGAKGC